MQRDEKVFLTHRAHTAYDSSMLKKSVCWSRFKGKYVYKGVFSNNKKVLTNFITGFWELNCDLLFS
ncbi:hypothetical protein BCM40_12870 [Planococcus donghaensis]|uniref:Uncharacterized protein n=1 Tax=Planococcus donghaensis TaxID=414778 RepID=A0A1C7EK39_9BACL|nr:hypothetical protein BCM40_12870 [Planococcus donghaensis]